MWVFRFPRYILFTFGYTWVCSLSIIMLVPADIWTANFDLPNGGLSFFWNWSIHANLVFYLILGSTGLFGLVLLIILNKISLAIFIGCKGGVLGFGMACSNTFGLVTGVFLLGFGLSEIPKSLWKNSDWTTHQKVLSHKIAKMAVKLHEAHQELSNAIVIAQATSNQMSKRDPLRHYMDVIDNMLTEMLRQDPSFNPQGGQLGENDMDYDADEKSMASLRRNLGCSREQYYRYKSEYISYVSEALELEDTIKNYEHGSSTGWFAPNYVVEFFWRCILRKQLEKLLVILLATMSAAILLAEATLLPSGVDLSLFSILIYSAGRQEVLVQVFAFVPLIYMCICTYYSFFKVGMLMFYSLKPRQTSSVSLMVARYASPISYNFLNLINLGTKRTIFEKHMGKIDDAVSFFGDGFNRIYPLIMVVYTLLVASNFFVRVIGFFGSWKRFKFPTEADGFDSLGIIILQKEQGPKVGERVIPLTRNFNTVDIESGTDSRDKTALEMKATSRLVTTDGSPSQPVKEEIGQRYGSSREAMSNKYAAIREQSRQVSLLHAGDSNSNRRIIHWFGLKVGIISSSSTSPPETKLTSYNPSSESLDEIFQKLKQATINHGNPNDKDEDRTETGIHIPRPAR
ncbi:hypothetical protein K2173_014800 [Erythroxylum novogranatense]|uniref:LMBR1-like membrane protein n=1 Tax=Erythroxylum novogranatense TaxID=1862640 RepID=A0AAV8TIA0_9ROSI|nr:hypothetical protein K2173_014800 [Erythroxylum novogranatense]